LDSRASDLREINQHVGGTCFFNPYKFLYSEDEDIVLLPILETSTRIYGAASHKNVIFIVTKEYCCHCYVSETASVVQWSEFLATDPGVRVRFLAVPDFPRKVWNGVHSAL
jgi:hypothetical protein